MIKLVLHVTAAAITILAFAALPAMAEIPAPLLQKAEAGDALAQYMLSKEYIDSDPRQSFIWMSRAAEQGMPMALYSRAFYYNFMKDEAFADADGTVPSDAEQRERQFADFKAAAQAGYPDAHIHVWYVLSERAEETVKFTPADEYDEALRTNADFRSGVEWLKKGVALGCEECIDALLELYNRVLPDPDFMERFMLVQLGGQDLENPKHMRQLALFYLTGTAVPKDEKTGLDWLKYSAALGCQKAQFEMSNILATSDPEMAERWKALSREDLVNDTCYIQPF